ncbi:ABC transporter ATP-binding protein [Paenibacillus dendritiformis]|uniref:ABC transporter ATP-binding protein n=1 Tax=Paenibacillus dendritiformis TaxID=130049 RepID=UPI0020C4D5D2|nr:ABC transporter ATP-binding protein [Paenibacillus dendritiformis]CAH8767697.1 energy-coupling factor ABC transporter ATP-binding protein [Paenibacillus dendritiformis]
MSRVNESRVNERVAAIEAEGLTLAFEAGADPILSGIDVRIGDGETVLLLGPSGCGKSSLALCLAGLYPHAIDSEVRGRVLVYGKPVAERAAGDAPWAAGIVFQDFESQFCLLRVEEEIAFCLENLGCPREEMDGRISGALAAVDLAAWRAAPIHELSGGMKQRLALACAIAMETRLLVLDEPTSNLDPSSRRQFAALVRDLARARGLAVLVIEHQLDEWIGQADRLLVMDAAGAIAYDGPPAAYYAGAVPEAPGIWLPGPLRLYRELRRLVPGEEPPALAAVLTEPDLAAELARWSEAGQERALQALTAPSPSGGRPAGDHAGGKPAPLLEAEGLRFRRGGRPVADGISLTLRTGEWVAIAGPNGAGKSTLASLLAGLNEPESGAVRLQGKPLGDYTEKELRTWIGYVFQNPEHQFITDTVADELAFGLRLQGIAPAAIEQAVQEALRRLRLENAAQASPFSLSQGQKRRLSVASALTDAQRLLILDEPTYGQDADTTRELMDMLGERVRQGDAVIMITHDMELAHAYADRIVVLRDGRTAYDGPPATLWSDHAELAADCQLLPPLRCAAAGRLTELIASRREKHAEFAGLESEH